MAKNGALREVIASWYRGWTDECVTTPNGSLYHKDGVLFSYGEHFPLALHIGSKVLINGDRYSKSTGKHQSYTIGQVSEYERVEVPFSALGRALGNGKVYGGYGIDLKLLQTNLRVVDQRGDTWIDTGRINKKTGEPILQHILGACVFEYTQDDKRRFFFSGIDETGKGMHKYFLTELTRPVNTVSEGLESMKPWEVIDAENEGKEVLRQGEWFFVKCDDQEMSKIQVKGKEEKNYTLRGQDGDTGHHYVTYGTYTVIGDTPYQIVKGIVKHSEGDHKQLKLYSDVKCKEYYLAYHNVQVQSFNAVGNVD